MEDEKPIAPVVIDARNWTGDAEPGLRAEQERREARQMAFEARLKRWPFAYGAVFVLAGVGMIALPWLAQASAADRWAAFDVMVASAVGVAACTAGALQFRRGFRARRAIRS